MEHKGKIQAEGIVSARLMVDMESLYDTFGEKNVSGVATITQSEMDAFGLTEEAVDALLDARYNKIASNIAENRDIWSYDGYEIGTYIYLFIRQGDGSDVLNAYSLTKTKSNNTWKVTFTEI